MHARRADGSSEEGTGGLSDLSSIGDVSEISDAEDVTDLTPDELENGLHENGSDWEEGATCTTCTECYSSESDSDVLVADEDMDEDLKRLQNDFECTDVRLKPCTMDHIVGILFHNVEFVPTVDIVQTDDYLRFILDVPGRARSTVTACTCALTRELL